MSEYPGIPMGLNLQAALFGGRIETAIPTLVCARLPYPASVGAARSVYSLPESLGAGLERSVMPGGLPTGSIAVIHQSLADLVGLRQYGLSAPQAGRFYRAGRVGTSAAAILGGIMA